MMRFEDVIARFFVALVALAFMLRFTELDQYIRILFGADPISFLTNSVNYLIDVFGALGFLMIVALMIICWLIIAFIVNYAKHFKAFFTLLNTSLPRAMSLAMAVAFRFKSKWDVLACLRIIETGGPKAPALLALPSPNVRDRILTTYGDGSARLWDGSIGRPLAKFDGHARAIVAAAFSPDGATIVTASYDGTARLWNAGSGEPSTSLLRHERAVNAATFNPSGTRVVTASDDGTARLWDTASGECLAIFRGHSGSVISIAFNADGTRIVTGSGDGTARIWRVLPTTQTLIDEARRLLPIIKGQNQVSQGPIPVAESIA